MPTKGLWLSADREVTAEGTRIGTKRQKNREDNDRESGRAPVAPEEQLANNIMAAIGECVVWTRLFPYLAWDAYREKGFRGTAEFGGFIDVKAARPYRRPPCNMYVKRDTKTENDMLNIHPSWAYVHACSFFHPRWWIGGWMWGWEVMVYPVKFAPSHCYAVPEAALHPMWILQKIARERTLNQGV